MCSYFCTSIIVSVRRLCIISTKYVHLCANVRDRTFFPSFDERCAMPPFCLSFLILSNKYFHLNSRINNISTFAKLVLTYVIVYERQGVAYDNNENM